jgi:hypothetical protein
VGGGNSNNCHNNKGKGYGGSDGCMTFGEVGFLLH